MEKLKKVQTAEKKTDIKEIIQREKELNRRLQEADLLFWYESIKEFTYPSYFVDFTPEEARAMVEYKSKKGDRSIESFSELVSLESKIQTVLDQIVSENEKPEVFVKLSSRSPKDATNRKDKKSELLVTYLKDMKQKNGAITKDEIIDCIYQAHIDALKLSTPREVIETLLSSDRVMNDEIPLALEHCKNVWNEKLIIRKWCSVPIKYELRGFVIDNKLTGLCQYYDEIFYHQLYDNKDKIQNLVLGFFDTIKNIIPITPKEYVVDFLVDLPNEKVIVVEINPFGKPDGMGTGTVMFNLKDDNDAKTLFGENPFEFRIETVGITDEKFKIMTSPIYDHLIKPNC
eukprot:TRINITY_DN375_c1_g1_i1.p2 TRINITY_DN375_c1_g1~~TRINITY_DN375_c1_g1_i1.p2  ORF type:complete len:344 (-),score=70.84 TRINITY_DN375_c1_g1_i1:71-1102(-)